MTELTREQVKIVLAIAQQGPDAVQSILGRLDTAAADCVPLIMVLGEIGSPKACPRLEEIADAFEVDDTIGQAARKALTHCNSDATAEFALKALSGDTPEATDLGFWMVKQGHLRDCHEQVSEAARRLAEEGSLEDTAFLEAAAIAQSSASPSSWGALDAACRRVLTTQHTVWLYRPLIRSGLPHACVLLLELVVRLWREHGQAVSGITYALWALAEEPVSEKQVAAIEIWLADGADVAGLSEALAVVSESEGWGHALEIATRLALDVVGDMFEQALGDERSCWGAGSLAKMIPHAAAVDDLLAGARDQQTNRGLSGDCAEALAARDTDDAFEALVTAIREWEVLPTDVAYAFAPAALQVGRLPDCRTWLVDPAESKCLRQASALAVGLAIYRAEEGEDVTELVSALESALSDEDVTYAAATGCSMAQVEELLTRLQEIVEAGGPVASEAAFSVVNIGTEPALDFLYGICASKGLDYLNWAPAEALAKSLKERFAEPSSRHGAHWERARDWLVDTYKRLDREATSGSIWSGVVVAAALLDCAVEWGIDSLVPTVEAQALSDPSPASISSSVIHQRWRLLAHHRSTALLKIARRYPAEQVSDSNKPHLAQALMEITEQAKEISDLVLSISQEAETLARREVAFAMARCSPSWLSEIPVSTANAPLLRDVAVFADEDVADAIIGRLLASGSGRLRRYGHQATEGRENQQQALTMLAAFSEDDSPSRRLWWARSFTALVDEKALAELDCLKLPSDDLSHEFAARDMLESARKRIKKDARDEDRSLERGSTPWVW